MTLRLISRSRLVALAAALCIAGPGAAWAHRESVASELSAISMLPVAVVVAAPAMVLSAGVTLTVVSVEAGARGSVWVLERASDGARASIHLGSHVAAGASVAVGTVVACTAVSTGWVLSAAGRAIAFIPNEIGKALLHNERITP